MKRTSSLVAAARTLRHRGRSVGSIRVWSYRLHVSHPHHRWLDEWTRAIAEDYERLHEEAKRQEVQRAGHGAEETWASLLREWLPPAYSVGTRRYIVPERGEEAFETDVVVFNPGYPKRLRDRRDVLAGGIAAAFSVKLTLDAAAVRDAIDRAARLRRATLPRVGTVRSELLGPFAVGLLAHSHSWRRPSSTPAENVAEHCWQLDHEIVEHPRESLDLLCVSDLASWSRTRAFLPGRLLEGNGAANERHRAEGACMTAFVRGSDDDGPAPVARFVAYLIERLSYADPTLAPVADGLRLTNTWGGGGGPMRLWHLDDVFDDRVRATLTHGANPGGIDWRVGYQA